MPPRSCSPATSATRRSTLAHRLSSAASRNARGRDPRRPHPERLVEKAVERMITRGPLGRQQMGNLRVYAGTEHPHDAQNPRDPRCRRHEPEEQEGPSRWADTRPSLAQGSQERRGSCRRRRPRPRRRRRIDKFGRAFATGKRKNAVARVWIKRGAGKMTINGRDLAVYFARPVLRMMIQPAARRRQPAGPVRHHRHRRRRRPLRPGRRGAPRHLEGADLLRAGAARRAEEAGLPHPRRPRGRAQEVRPPQGPPQLPVLEALSDRCSLRYNPTRFWKDAFEVPFFVCASCS